MNPSDKSTSDNLEEFQDDSRAQLPSFLGRPLASSSHCLSPNVELLKSYMVQEENRRHFSRAGGGDLFLKPLPASGYYGRPIMTSQMGYHGGGYPFPCVYGNCFQPFDHFLQTQLYRSRSEPFAVGQNKSDNPSSDSDKDDRGGILKKPKVSEVVKDITINNSLVVIPNLNDFSSNTDSKGISELSTKLIEDFNKLKEGTREESKESKMVQFDLGAGSPVKDSLDSSFKSREQFSSLSTNESLQWQTANVNSPTNISGRMEWDSAADVGYIEMDMSKEKLSTLERVTLEGMARKGNAEKKVVYKKTSRGERILKRIPSDVLELEERKATPIMKETGTNPEEVEASEIRRQTSDNNTQTTDEPTLTPETIEPKKQKSRKLKKIEKRAKPIEDEDFPPLPVINPASIEDEDLPPLPEMKDQSTLVNTLDDDLILRKLSTSSEEKPSSSRVKKLTKKKSHDVSLRSQKIQQILDIARAIEYSESMEHPPKARSSSIDSVSPKKQAPKQPKTRSPSIDLNFTIEQTPPQPKARSPSIDSNSAKEQTPPQPKARSSSIDSTKEKAPAQPKTKSPSTESNSTILPQRSFESKGVQVKVSPKLMSSKNIQASGELNSLPKHLDNSKMSKSSGGVRNKSTQFFGEGSHSLPRGLESSEKKPKQISPQKEKSSLTKKALKSRNEPADRGIVREKFFQSQMVSRSTETGHSLVTAKSAATSMTRPDHSTLEFENVPQSTLVDPEPRPPQMVNIGVQYSPKEEPQRLPVERRQHRDAWTDTIDSQASSTQTAHSWVHGGAPIRESVVRPTRSFEYLPGDVYENSNNIREILPSETSQNVITESESSAESVEHPVANPPSDSEGGRKLSSGTVVLEDTGMSSAGAWLLVKGDAVDVVRRRENNGVSEISGKFTSGSDKRQQSVARMVKCSTSVQTDSVIGQKDPELIKVLKEALQALLAEKRSRRDPVERKSEDSKAENGSSNSQLSSLYALISKTGQSSVQERAMSTPQACACDQALECVKDSSASTENTQNSSRSTSQKLSKYSASLPPTPRLEYVSVETQSEHNPTHHQSTQMSQRNPFKDTSTQMGSSLGRKTETHPSRHDQATQMSNRGSVKSSQVLTNSESEKKKSAQVCNGCGHSSCVCGENLNDGKNGSSSRKMLKTINGEVFSTFLDVDFSSSEVMSSASTSGQKNKNCENDKENIQCSVCRCRFNNQDCVFCPCHIDKKTHIPRCDCHDKIPRYLIPGFCKCHKRNLRHVNKCKCAEQNNVENNKCPCCEYFASRMRSQLLAAQIDTVKTPKKSTQSLPAKNYFLKLEETEVSKDSSDVSVTGQKPLEVVTIKIPVKRMGKAKVPCNQFYYSGEVQRSKHDDIEFLDDIVRKYRGLISSRQQSSQSYPKGSLSERASVGTFSSYRTLQECLESNRPDFLNSAEYRRQMINERAREREKRRIEPKKLIPTMPIPSQPPKRMFTTAELHQQNRKHYKKLPEVAQKKEDEKKREIYRTNKLMAEIYAKKLQLKTLRGQLNFSNSCDLLTT